MKLLAPSRLLAIAALVVCAAMSLTAFAGWSPALTDAVAPGNGPDPAPLLLIGVVLTAVGLLFRGDPSSPR